MTVEHLCDLCSNPCDPSAYVCARCTDETAGYLRGAELAGEVETTVALLARYSVSRGATKADAVPDDQTADPEALRPSQRANTFAWAASRELPEANALRPTRLPVDLNASARAAHAFNHITTWARVVEDDRGSEVPTPLPGQHPAAVAAAFLLANLEWIRHQPFAAEAFDQLRAAGATIRRIVDRPPDQVLVGKCDCGNVLYEYAGRTTTTCDQCGLTWDVLESRDNMWTALRGYLVTASEAALLLMLHSIGGGNRRRIAKTVTMWAQRGLIATRGEADGAPLYLFGEVIDRATRSQDRPVA